MNKLLSRSARRAGVIVAYGAALAFAAAFCFGEYREWSFTLGAIAVLAAGVSMALTYSTLARTGLLRLTHTGVEKLDERQVQITHTALRHSYSIFAALTLLLVAFMVLSVRFSIVTLTHRGHYSFGLMVLILLQYLVQTLPASILAWTEQEVLVG